MSLNPLQMYPGATVADPAFPGDKYKDSSSPSVFDGTPLDELLNNQNLSLETAIMTDSGEVYNNAVDTPATSQLFTAHKKAFGNGNNFLQNSNFVIVTPDDSQPTPDATPRTYVPGYEVFSGWFADDVIGITNLTYDNGVINFTAGTLYQDIPKSGALVELSAFTASISGTDLKVKTDNVSQSLIVDKYRVVIVSTAVDVFSVKFETGLFATGHSVVIENKPFQSVSEMVKTGGLINSVISTVSYYGGWAVVMEPPRGSAIYDVIKLTQYPGSPDDFLDHALDDGVNVAVLRKDRPVYFDQCGAKANDDSFDSYDAIMAAMGALRELYLTPLSFYSTTQEIECFDRRRIIGAGEQSGFKWTGAAGVSAPDKTGGTSVIRFARPDPFTSALGNIHAANFTVDINFTQNIIGTSWMYSTVKSSGDYIKAINMGVNSFGHYFSKLWYCDFNAMTVRPGIAAPSGSRGLFLSGYYGQINTVPFLNSQCNGAQIGCVLNTEDAGFTGITMSGEFENNIDGLKHETGPGGFGVKTADFRGLYFEGNSNADINWKTDAGASTLSQMINWRSCHFNESGSKVIIEEGGHRFEGCDRILEVQCETNGRVWIDGNGGLIKSGGAPGNIRHFPVVTATDTDQEYSGTEIYPLGGMTSIRTFTGATVQVLQIPDFTVAGSSPPNGRVVKLHIVGRRNYNGVEKNWVGTLSQNSVGVWSIQKDYGSTDDASWTVAIGSTVTGQVDVTFPAADTKIINAMWTPF